MHGNEPAGVYALSRVFLQLEVFKTPFFGKLVGLCGNCAALPHGKRYIDKDLNRLWSRSEIARVRALDAQQRNTEEQQLLELLDLIERLLEEAEGEKLLIDLHTTSAPGGLFSIVSNDAYNRELASALHAPVIFNLMNSLSTTTNVYIEDMGIKGLAFEAGQHDDPRSVDIHEAAIWLLLEQAGCILPEHVPETEIYHERLITAARHLPHYVQVTYRHAISPDDRFHMYPGYTNFHQVYKNEPLARDKNGAVKCPTSGLLVMPLYQPQGEEGFFIVQQIDEPPQ